VRAFNTLQARVLADENHRLPRWVLFLSGDEQAKPAVAQLIADAGFEPVDLGGIDDSQLASFPDARSAAGDLHRRFRFLGDASVWRLLTSAARDA
jgi:hypothetical protein